MHITAAVARQAGQPFTLETLDLADPREHEVLVEIRGVGICHTDVAARDGVYGLPYPGGRPDGGNALSTDGAPRPRPLPPLGGALADSLAVGHGRRQRLRQRPLRAVRRRAGQRAGPRARPRGPALLPVRQERLPGRIVTRTEHR